MFGNKGTAFATILLLLGVEVAALHCFCDNIKWDGENPLVVASRRRAICKGSGHNVAGIGNCGNNSIMMACCVGANETGGYEQRCKAYGGKSYCYECPVC